MKKQRLVSLVLAALCSTWPMLSLAGDARLCEPRNDVVTLSLQTESWAKTIAATVTITIQAVPDAKDPNRTRKAINNALARVGWDSDWKILAYDQVLDATGQEVWQVVAEGRAKDSAAVGLFAEADRESKPGFKMAVARVIYEPTVAEREAVLAKLREDLVKRAQAELVTLNKTMAGRQFSLHAINFRPDQDVPGAPALRTDAAWTATPGKNMMLPLPVAHRLIVQAEVIFHAEPLIGEPAVPAEPKPAGQ